MLLAFRLHRLSETVRDGSAGDYLSMDVHAVSIRFLMIGVILMSLMSALEVSAQSETRSVSLCDGIKATVTAIATRSQKKSILNAINYAVTGARESCKIVSTRGSQSQTRLINEKAGNAFVPVGLDLQYLLPRVIRISHMTGGAFDPMAWSRRKKSNYRDISFDPNSRQAMLKRRGEILSFHGILKGYLADRIAARLRKRGVNRYLINVGGSVTKASGRGNNSSWMTGIQDPHNRAEDSICRLALVNKAMATVAAYPWHQGVASFPGAAAFASVSILMSDASTAEALANTAMVLGEKAKTLLKRTRGAGAVIISHEGRLSIIGNVPAACIR